MGVSRAEQQLAWREDRMKQEVADIQKVYFTIHHIHRNILVQFINRGCKKLKIEIKSLPLPFHKVCTVLFNCMWTLCPITIIFYSN